MADDIFEIHVPPNADDLGRASLEGFISRDLVALTFRLSRAGVDTEGGLLGGRFGYGANFENAQFSMHKFCWCERPDCGWCDYSDDDDDPSTRLPHFAIKGTPIEVRWYKWIGRSMDIRPADLTPEQWRAAFADCLHSIGPNPDSATHGKGGAGR